MKQLLKNIQIIDTQSKSDIISKCDMHMLKSINVKKVLLQDNLFIGMLSNDNIVPSNVVENELNMVSESINGMNPNISTRLVSGVFSVTVKKRNKISFLIDKFRKMGFGLVKSASLSHNIISYRDNMNAHTFYISKEDPMIVAIKVLDMFAFTSEFTDKVLEHISTPKEVEVLDLDVILDKITRLGTESLTVNERKFLDNFK